MRIRSRLCNAPFLPVGWSLFSSILNSGVQLILHMRCIEVYGPLKDTGKSEDCMDGQVHKEMMRIILKDFTKRGFTNIRANFEGMPLPEKIDEFTPDITCNRNDGHQAPLILEVETYKTMTQSQSEHKWKIFYEKTRRMTGEFHLAVPKFCNGNSGRVLASQRLREFGIKAEYVWEVNGYLQQFALQFETKNLIR